MATAGVASTDAYVDTGNFSVVLGGMARSKWDPLASSDWDKEKPSTECILRIKRSEIALYDVTQDVMRVFSDPPPGVYILPDEDNCTRVHSLITGNIGTPYEGGFFYFVIGCPPIYPLSPPRVRLMTTGDNTVRFNPNLYKNGKVCLSILGTWPGPCWTPSQSLSSVLISIQSLMNENPYHNEPGFERERYIGDSNRYNQCIQHETLRVAVCDMLDGRTSCPPQFREVMEGSFLDYYDYYTSVVQSNVYLNGQIMADPFGEHRGTFNFAAIDGRLQVLKARIEAQQSS